MLPKMSKPFQHHSEANFARALNKLQATNAITTSLLQKQDSLNVTGAVLCVHADYVRCAVSGGRRSMIDC